MSIATALIFTLGITSQTDSHVIKNRSKYDGRRRPWWLMSLDPEFSPGSFFIDTRYKSSVLTI